MKRPVSKDSHTWFMPVYRRLCRVTAAHVSLLMCFEVACTQHSHTFEVQFREVFLMVVGSFLLLLFLHVHSALLLTMQTETGSNSLLDD